ncbi:VIT1/CCC1 family protein [Microgenomates group bacterium]|nr:VIT1/CCC1 family protein [Microgenomates group bacterium]
MTRDKRIINPRLRAIALEMEQEEINEYGVYVALAGEIGDPHNAGVLIKMAELEKEHAEFWAERTGVMLEPQKWRVRLMVMLAKVLGLMFVLKLMERTMGVAQEKYQLLMKKVPEVVRVSADFTKHEMELLEILNEERLHFMGAIVMGLDSAFVGLIGMLAGLTLAMNDTSLISLAGLIAGISIALEAGVGEYVSKRTEDDAQALKAGLWTLGASAGTVMVLIAPFLLIKVGMLALLWTVVLAVGMMAVVNFYLAVVKNTKFGGRFREMAMVTFGVMVVSGVLGLILRRLFF